MNRLVAPERPATLELAVELDLGRSHVRALECVVVLERRVDEDPVVEIVQGCLVREGPGPLSVPGAADK